MTGKKKIVVKKTIKKDDKEEKSSALVESLLKDTEKRIESRKEKVLRNSFKFKWFKPFDIVKISSKMNTLRNDNVVIPDEVFLDYFFKKEQRNIVAHVFEKLSGRFNCEETSDFKVDGKKIAEVFTIIDYLVRWHYDQLRVSRLFYLNVKKFEKEMKYVFSPKETHLENSKIGLRFFIAPHDHDLLSCLNCFE